MFSDFMNPDKIIRSDPMYTLRSKKSCGNKQNRKLFIKNYLDNIDFIDDK